MSPRVSIIIPVYNVEKYIEKMLMSVKQQSFRDYEVIIINDGSTDGSQKIIDGFCDNDSRFKSILKENGGVASARNMGLDNAMGEFVVFYDPDDYIPPKALKKLYKNIVKNNADMAIGIMKEIRAGESRCNGRTIKLGKKQNISKYDVELPWSFSVCNKMFRLKMIKENGLTFKTLKHAEDALFLFQCIFASKKITGCNTIVYEYQFRPFWESRSATQIMKVEYLKDVIKALDAIEELIIKQISAETDIEKSNAEALLREFYARYLHTSLISGYYRQLWSAEEGCLEILEAKIKEIKEKTDDKLWERIISLNRDLQLEKNIFDKNTAAKEALLTFVIPQGMSNEKLGLILNSIYDQSMPSFRVAVPEEYQNQIISTKQQKPNMFFTKESNLENIDTELVMFSSAGFLISKNAVRFMVEALLKDSSINYASVPLKSYDGCMYSGTVQECAFTVIQCLKNKITKYDILDRMRGNKVFRTAIANNALESLNKKKVFNANMIVLIDHMKSQSYLESQKVSVGIKIKRIQKTFEDKVVDHIKNHYTKDDIKRLIRKGI